MIFIINAILGILSSRYLLILFVLPLMIFYLMRVMKYNLKKIIFNIIVFLVFFSYSFLIYNVISGSNKNSGVIYKKSEYTYGAKYLIYNNHFNKSLVYSSDTSFEEGDKVSYNGEVVKFKTNSMPKLFNEKIYYNSIGVNNKLIKAKINKLSDSFLKPIFRLKSNLRKIYRENLNDNAYFLSSGSILTKIDENIIYDKMRFAGLSHILSTSGLHVAILYAFIFFIVGLVFQNIKIRVILSLIIIWLYGFMLVFPPSLLRAIIMISVMEFAKLYDPTIKRVDSLKYAFIISLIFNPYYLFNVGFILSYLCVFSIFYIAPYFRKFIKRESSFLEILNVNVSIIIITLPVTIYFFNHYNLLTIIWNLIYVPIFSIYINFSFMFLFIHRIPIVGFMCKIILNNMANIIDFCLTITSFKFLAITTKSPNILSIILYYFSIYIFVEQEYLRLRFYSKIKSLIPFLMSLILLPILFVRDYDFVRFLDVGQGDSCHIHVEGKNFLVDSGGNILNPGSVGKYILEPYLVKNGFKNIEGAFISHFDYDHYGGFTELSQDVNINHFISDHRVNIMGNDNIYKILRKLEFPKRDELEIGKGYSLNFIPYKKDITKENNASMVFILKKDNINLVLFTGDIESEVEKQILKCQIKSYILKVPHHGSKSSSTEKFLNAVNSKYSVISVGANNKYGHPNKSVLKRLKNKGYVFRTDEDGMIELNLKDNSIISFNNYLCINELIYTIFIIIISYVIVRKVDRCDGLYKFFEES